MLHEKAGKIAGQIWQMLNKNGQLTLKEMKKSAKLTEKDFNLGLGWLLREDKINILTIDDEFIFSLK